MKYYIAENGQAVGPFEPKELMARGLTVNSLVCAEGMPSWTSASQVPELMALLSGGSVGASGTGGVDLPQVPPVGGNVTLPPLPEVPQVGGDVSLPQVPPITNPAPTPTTTNQGGSTLPNSPLPFPESGSTTKTNATGAPKTWLLESVIATIVCSVCCSVPFIGLIPGFVAIYNAWCARTCNAKGDTAGANKKSASAKKWFYITIAVGLACAVYGAFNTMQNSNITDVINDIQNGDMPFFYGLPK